MVDVIVNDCRCGSERCGSAVLAIGPGAPVKKMLRGPEDEGVECPAGVLGHEDCWELAGVLVALSVRNTSGKELAAGLAGAMKRIMAEVSKLTGVKVGVEEAEGGAGWLPCRRCGSPGLNVAEGVEGRVKVDGKDGRVLANSADPLVMCDRCAAGYRDEVCAKSGVHEAAVFGFGGGKAIVVCACREEIEFPCGSTEEEQRIVRDWKTWPAVTVTQ